MTAAQITRRVRQAVHRRLLRHGWLVRKVRGNPHGWPNGQAFWTPAYIQRLGFHPATLVDIGVGPGTPDIYEAFPDSYLVLAEPQEEFFAAAREILSRRPGVLVPFAVGASERTQALLVEPDAPLHSSLFAYDPTIRARDKERPFGITIVKREVQVTTLDALLKEHRWAAPFGLKIDSQGAELEIILGATEFLGQADFVIAEVNMIDRYPGSYSFAGFIAAMDDAGFAACDIFDIARTPSSEVKYMDLVFRRRAA